MSQTEIEQDFGTSFNYVLSFQGKPFAIEKRLAGNLLLKLKYTKQYQGDMVIFVDGFEGTGKSTLARQIAKLLDPNFDHHHITYDKDDCMRLYKTLPDWSAIVLDESDEGVNRKDTMAKGNKNFTSFMKQSRQAHKILIMCGPTIFDIDGYIAEHRVTFLVHCYFKDGLHPGNFKFYNKHDIHRLFLFDKKAREYKQTPQFNGDFGKADTCDMEVYNLKKKAAFQKFFNNIGAEAPVSREEAEMDYKRRRAIAYTEVAKRTKITIKAYCDALGVSRTAFKSWHEKEGIDLKAFRNRDASQDVIDDEPEYFKEDRKPAKIEDKGVRPLVLGGVKRRVERAEPTPLLYTRLQ